MVQNSGALVSLALDLDDVPHSSKAFQLLCVANEEVFHHLIEHDVFSQTAARIFVESPVAVVVNRLACMAGAAYLSAPELAVQRRVSFTGFLPFVHCSSVFEMLLSFLQNTDPCRHLQEGLRVDGFPHCLLSSADRIDQDSLPENGAALFRLIAAVAGTDSLSDIVRTADALGGVAREIEGVSTTVLNAQYEAIDAIVVDANIFVIVEQLPRFVAKLDPSRGAVSEFHIIIIRLMRRILVTDGGPAAVAKTDLADRFGAILRQFPAHSIVHSAISAFVVELLDYPELTAPFFDAVLPLVGEALVGETVEKRGFAWRFLVDFRRKDEQAALRVIRTGVWDAYRSLNTIAEASYGGDLPKGQSGEVGPGKAQMISLFLALMQQRR
jgi:hypothetical protein